MKRLSEALLALLFPRRAVCMGCGSAAGCREDWICPACRERLAAQWVGAEPPDYGFDAMAFAYVYLGPVAGIVRRMKYGGVSRLAAFMGEDMVRAWRFLEPIGADMVVSVPMYPSRRRQRGGNHAEQLAMDVARRLELPCVDALARVRNTPQQAMLDDDARRSNLSGAFALKAPVRDRRVILVDDVCTTGTTARACAAQLKAGGAEKVYLLCYARAGRRSERGERGPVGMEG